MRFQARGKATDDSAMARESSMVQCCCDCVCGIIVTFRKHEERTETERPRKSGDPGQMELIPIPFDAMINAAHSAIPSLNSGSYFPNIDLGVNEK